METTKYLYEVIYRFKSGEKIELTVIADSISSVKKVIRPYNKKVHLLRFIWNTKKQAK